MTDAELVARKLTFLREHLARMRDRRTGYASMDVDRLWADVPTGVAAFESFSVAVARHAGKVAT